VTYPGGIKEQTAGRECGPDIPEYAPTSTWLRADVSGIPWTSKTFRIGCCRPSDSGKPYRKSLICKAKTKRSHGRGRIPYHKSLILLIILAERVGFEPTCRNYPTIRFRVGAVMTTSVPLQMSRLGEPFRAPIFRGWYSS
jgi:hypothetical protein